MKQTSYPPAPLADAAGREADAAGFEPGHGRGQVVDPEPDVVQGRFMDLRARLGVEGGHQIDLDGIVPVPDASDHLVDVLALGAIAPVDLEAQEVEPEMFERAALTRADGDLLHAKDSKRPLAHDGPL